jgi:hypothetical protein
LFAVASRNSPSYRKQGFTSRCIDALIVHFSSRIPESISIPASLKLWVIVVEEVNRVYWRKRGFEQVGEELIRPKGAWNAAREFGLINMMKVVAVSNNTPQINH